MPKQYRNTNDLEGGFLHTPQPYLEIEFVHSARLRNILTFTGYSMFGRLTRKPENYDIPVCFEPPFEELAATRSGHVDQ